MFSTLRTRFGIPGVISVMALVFAMFGGAYAASNSSDGGKATASAKAKKGPRGPKGATGPAGPAGAQGPAGAAGAKGDAGAAGSNGTNGAPGAAGKSVVTTQLAPGEGGCAEGGTKLEVQGSGNSEVVCNGEPGQQGPKGDPWTLDGTLPVGATETGAWKVTALQGNPVATDLSFTVQLQQALPEEKVHLFSDADFATHCTGTEVAPTAPSGELCVYGSQLGVELSIEKPGAGGGRGAGKSGAYLSGFVSGAFANAQGAWAVTG